MIPELPIGAMIVAAESNEVLTLTTVGWVLVERGLENCVPVREDAFQALKKRATK